MEDSIFIKVLEHGEEVGLDGTNMAFLKDYIEKKMRTDFNHSDHKLKIEPLDRLFAECFRIFEGGKNGRNHILKIEYYFRLIEYRELQEARAASKSANRNAMRAICLSIIAIIISAVLTLAQLNAPTTINQSDLQALMNSNAVQREVKLDSLQMAQILTAIGYDKHRPMVKKQRTTDQGKEISHHELINKYFEEE